MKNAYIKAYNKDRKAIASESNIVLLKNLEKDKKDEKFVNDSNINLPLALKSNMKRAVKNSKLKVFL